MSPGARFSPNVFGFTCLKESSGHTGAAEHCACLKPGFLKEMEGSPGQTPCSRGDLWHSRQLFHPSAVISCLFLLSFPRQDSARVFG